MMEAENSIWISVFYATIKESHLSSWNNEQGRIQSDLFLPKEKQIIRCILPTKSSTDILLNLFSPSLSFQNVKHLGFPLQAPRKQQPFEDILSTISFSDKPRWNSRRTPFNISSVFLGFHVFYFIH